MICAGLIILWWFVGLFNDSDYILTITDLLSQLDEKDFLIYKYKNEVLDWSHKYEVLEQQLLLINEKLELTKHSLKLTSEALNQYTMENSIENSYESSIENSYENDNK